MDLDVEEERCDIHPYFEIHIFLAYLSSFSVMVSWL